MLLLERGELDRDGIVRLVDRRARHVREVLRVQAGQQLCAGILDGPIGTAEVLAIDADGSVVVRAACDRPAPIASDWLLLAVPRPKALLRMLEHAAALGCADIVLFRSWRVDRSHLESRALDPATQREHLRLGLEQAQRTALPRVHTHLLFKPFVEDVLPTLPLPAHRFTGHPDAATSTAELQLSRAAPFALALGPDGGFLPYEIEQLGKQGFLPVRMAPQPLRTETALAAMYAQLDLLRRRQ